MRVLTFLHSYDPGGVERVALRLVRRWRAMGVEAPLFVGRDDGAMRDDVGAGLACRMPRRGPGVAWWETLWMILTLPRAIREERPDVLFCAGNTYAVVAVAMRLLLGRRCPPIVLKVSNDLDRDDLSRLVRWGYRLWLRVQGPAFAHVVAMAPPAAAEASERLGTPPARVSVVPDPALSVDQIARLRAIRSITTGEGRRFVAVGRLARQKNLALLLQAFARGAEPADRLLIVGDGPERARLEREATALGIADRVRFAGYHPDPAALLPGHDSLLLSSDYEGLPAVVLEALAAGIAVVATRCSRSLPALLANGALGRLVPVGDEAAFAAAIAAVRPEEQNAAASLAQARRFTIEAAATLYLGAFARAAADHRPARVAAAEPGHQRA